MAFLLNFLLFFKVLRKDSFVWLPAPVFPLLLLAFLLYRAVFPWRLRRGVWIAVRNVLMAPFKPVSFRDSYAAQCHVPNATRSTSFHASLCGLLPPAVGMLAMS